MTIAQLVALNRLEEAIVAIGGNEAISLSGRLASLNRQVNLGIISNSDATIERNCISNAIISIGGTVNFLTSNSNSYTQKSSLSLGEFLDSFSNFLETAAKARFSNKLPELSGHLSSIQSFFESMGADFAEFILEITTLLKKIELKRIEQAEAITQAQSYYDVLVEVFQAQNSKGGIAELREKALTPGSSYDTMISYIDALVKDKKIANTDKYELIANYKAKGASQAVANMWLRGQIRYL